MGIVLGVDIGSSTTKIVGKSGAAIKGTLQIESSDPKASLYGGIDEFLEIHKFSLSDVSAVYLTGVGSSFIDGEVFGKETFKVPEFYAIGTGGLRISGLEEALVISMGTGTAFVRAAPDGIVHIGGTGVGGGTLFGLISQLSRKADIGEILSLAERGDLKNVDLLVGDVINHELETLPSNMTAANFGKVKGSVPDPDFALGVINMVFETIGAMALFALRNDAIGDIVLTGTLAAVPHAKIVFDKVAKLAGKNCLIPPEAVFATALGALEG